MVGFIYKHFDTGELYVVTKIESRYYLVCLNDGGFWSECSTQGRLEEMIYQDKFTLFNGSIPVRNGKVI